VDDSLINRFCFCGEHGAGDWIHDGWNFCISNNTCGCRDAMRWNYDLRLLINCKPYPSTIAARLAWRFTWSWSLLYRRVADTSGIELVMTNRCAILVRLYLTIGIQDLISHYFLPPNLFFVGCWNHLRRPAHFASTGRQNLKLALHAQEWIVDLLGRRRPRPRYVHIKIFRSWSIIRRGHRLLEFVNKYRSLNLLLHWTKRNIRLPKSLRVGFRV
jgi:hypothetical protein